MEPSLETLNGWSVAVSAWTVLMTVVGFIAMRTIKRVDDLEKRTASKSDIRELKEDIKELRQDFKDDLQQHREESATNIGHIADRLENIYDLLISRGKK